MLWFGKKKKTLLSSARETDSQRVSESDTVPPTSSFFIEVAKVVIIASLIIIPVRYFLIQPFYVRGASMEPNFHDFEYLVIDEVSFRFRVPERGEVVVFHNPDNTREYFIKRIIGLPGEKVQIRNSQITIFNAEHPDGFILDEFYLPDGLVTSGRFEENIPDDMYYVLGDNRPASHDSRVFGPIGAKLVVGRIWVRTWPFKRIHYFTPFDYPIQELPSTTTTN